MLCTAEKLFSSKQDRCVEIMFHIFRRYTSERYWPVVMKRKFTTALVDGNDPANLRVVWNCLRVQGLLEYFG